jgi:hypothetical protein
VAVLDIISTVAVPHCDACDERLDLRPCSRSDSEQRSTPF